MEHLKKMKQGIADFNSQKYWECHESLEDVWNEDAHDQARYVYWAVIQAASALIHYREGQIAGAMGLINKAKEKLRKCESLKVETPLLYEFLDWKKFKELVYKIPDNPELKDFDEIYKFRFNHYPFSRFAE